MSTDLITDPESIEESDKPPSKGRNKNKIINFNLAVLCKPAVKPAPSSLSTIRYFAKIASDLGVAVHQIDVNDFDRLNQFDGLWIRQTTSITNMTFAFAARAKALRIPVIDDYLSILICCNKIPQMSLLSEQGIKSPPTVLVSSDYFLDGIDRISKSPFGYPLVVKIPDGAFGHGMYKVDSLDDLGRALTKLFSQSQTVLVQPFLKSDFDWRIGVLGGKPLFACEYHFARGHWQIIKHYPDGKQREGSHYTKSLDEVPFKVLDLAVRATKALGGDGLYGVDIKEINNELIVMEVNDNPNLEHGIEDQIGGDEIWLKLAQWFLDRKLVKCHDKKKYIWY